MVLHKEMAVFEQVSDLLLESLAFLSQFAFDAGWAARCLRTWATARKMAWFKSLRIWNSQIWCGTAPKTTRIATGYKGDPSVVMPRTVNCRACKTT